MKGVSTSNNFARLQNLLEEEEGTDAAPGPQLYFSEGETRVFMKNTQSVGVENCVPAEALARETNATQ